MSARYQKTDAGREAIRTRAAALSRPARNLLLIIDDSKTGDEWVTLVVNATPADLAQLVDSAFVAEVAAPARGGAVARAAPAAVPVALLGPALEAALMSMSYRELYDKLTAETRARLGLIKGYRMVLEIEKCSGVDEIRRLAVKFIDDVRAAQGEDAAREFCRSLGADV